MLLLQPMGDAVLVSPHPLATRELPICELLLPEVESANVGTTSAKRLSLSQRCALLVATGKKKSFFSTVSIRIPFLFIYLRIKFGKPALKCADCRATCHVDCKPRMSTYCVPTAQTAASSNKGFAGTVADYAPASAPMIPAMAIHCVD